MENFKVVTTVLNGIQNFDGSTLVEMNCFSGSNSQEEV